MMKGGTLEMKGRRNEESIIFLTTRGAQERDKRRGETMRVFFSGTVKGEKWRGSQHSTRVNKSEYSSS